MRIITGYLTFARSYPRPLGFGAALTWLSSFGQTFFIALTGGAIAASFGLSDGALGTAYAAATLASGFLLGPAGRLIDRVSIRQYLGAATVLLAAGCVLTGMAGGLASIVGGYFLLRLAGQGLMVHIAMTSTARRFTQERGKALGLAALGLAVGEAMLPPLVVIALPLAGWRAIWFASAAVVLVAGFAAVLLAPVAGGATVGRGAVSAARTASLWRDGRFLAAIPAVLAPSFVMTGFFFHQVRLAEERHWTLAVVAAGFVGFAAIRAGAMLFVGPVIDRIGSIRLLPWFLAPLGLAMVVIMTWPGSDIAPLLYLAATALTAGAATTLITSVWTEMYGPARIASVRASVAGAGVIASALAPTIFGVLIDAGVSLAAIAVGCLVYLAAASLLTLRVGR
jgi:predicted MFS family arabinose efflux permease